MRKLFLGLLVVGFVAACSPSVDLSSIDPGDEEVVYTVTRGDQKIKIVGSSTVAPFTTAVAEQFGASSKYPTPIVESTGTGGGFKAFCQAIGPNEPTISNASRPIKPSEVELCARAGITHLVEVKIGFDGIVLANSKSAPNLDLTKTEIVLALAAELPDGQGGWIKNPNKTWQDVSDDLPDMQIIVSGPPPTSGTRDAFVEIAMESGALGIPGFADLKASDGDEFKRRAHNIRNDGAWIDSGENDSGIVQTLLKSDDSIGVMGYSFLEQNLDRIKGAKIGGVEPVFDEIASGNYQISRSMYFYVKKQNLPLVPGVEAFVDEFTKEDSWGPFGYLVDKGLIPLQEAQRQQVRQNALSMQVMEDAGS
ncbi:MAG: PstS family phosphate ABC transporter substrate-binding protein [Henriciella sp.]